jgi:hypothetical protein
MSGIQEGKSKVERDPVNQELDDLRNHIKLLRKALKYIVKTDRWNNKIYTGKDKWSYGDCAKTASEALKIKL